VPLILPAYAKLNLTLDVTGRRPDGYHDIDSVMQTISLHDLIWIERTDCRVFDVVGPMIAGENLVLKAARELEGHLSRALPFTIRLFKRLPMGAGLGGGSADAAAFLNTRAASAVVTEVHRRPEGRPGIGSQPRRRRRHVCVTDGKGPESASRTAQAL